MTRPIQVLLVEDNEADSDLICEILQEDRLHLEIMLAVDGVEALAILLKQPPHQNAARPDLILLDLNLPKMDGRQLLAEIKKHPNLRTIPVVIMTSSDAERDILNSYNLGASCYVTKPVDLAAFQAVVKSVQGFWFTIVKLP